jgi:endonuclease YncB( thermonuclease family)
MQMPTNLTPSPYATLRQEITEVLLASRAKARQLVEREIASAHWEVGRLLNTHLETHGTRAHYGEQVVQQLAADLEIDYRRLYEMLRVYRALPIFRATGKLTWTHYLTLLKAPEETREHYAQRAEEEGLSVRQLQEVIASAPALPPSAQTTEVQRKTASKLNARRGILHAYRLAELFHPNGKHELVLDLGFTLRRQVDLKDVVDPEAGTVVVSTRRGKGYTLARAEVKRDRLFTFVALVKRVVDGDTLLVEVDCGFGCWMQQRLRLRGIDTPELKTAEGQRTSAFVQDALGQVDFVVVKTARPDKYDRYLADVFYLPGEHDAGKVAAEGIYLNSHLLKAGLASAF